MNHSLVRQHQGLPHPVLSHPVTDRRAVFPQSTAAGSQFLQKTINWSYWIFAICAGYQCLFFWSTENVIALSCVLFGWVLLTQFFVTPGILRTYPLSTFLIIGFTSTQLYFPLVFTSVELKPLVFNLELPYEVFMHSIASLLVLLSAHYLYRFLPVQTKRGPNSILYRAGFFQPPEEAQLWMIGCLGLLANVYVYFFSLDTATEVTGNALDKAIQALLPFSYAPYLIPFKKMYGSQEKGSKHIVLLLVIFTVLLFLISMAKNSRGAFMIGFTSVGFAYGLGLLLNLFKPPVIGLKTMIIAIAGFWLITGPLADLGTAMVIVRSQRSDVSKTELIELTLKAFKDKQTIMLRRLGDKAFEHDWDERYLDNVFTARFANIKFNDASLVQASKVGVSNPLMQKYTVDYIWGMFPDPILKRIKPDVDKDQVYARSFGDYIYSLAGAGSNVYGGFRTGHFTGTGMAAFGWWYLVILGVTMIPVFMLFDKLVMTQTVIQRGAGVRGQTLTFSVCGLLSITLIFMFLPMESVANIITFIIRGFGQTFLLYFFIFHVTRLTINTFRSIFG